MKISFEIQKMKTRGYFAFCSSHIDLSVCGATVDDIQEKIRLSVQDYMQKHPELDNESLEISTKVLPIKPP